MRLFCWLGWHRYSLLVFGYTCELWVCRCGHFIVQFADDPRALHDVDKLNRWWRQGEAKVDR